MIRAGLSKNDTGKIKRRNENPNGDDWYLVQLDDGGTALYRRSQLDDAQAMMNAIGAMDTSSETPQQSEVASDQSDQSIEETEAAAAAEPASTRPRDGDDAAAVLMAMNTEFTASLREEKRQRIGESA